jgi:hypothetical protein
MQSVVCAAGHPVDRSTGEAKRSHDCGIACAEMRSGPVKAPGVAQRPGEGRHFNRVAELRSAASLTFR